MDSGLRDKVQSLRREQTRIVIYWLCGMLFIVIKKDVNRKRAESINRHNKLLKF